MSIDGLGYERLAETQSHPEVRWVELGTELLLCGGAESVYRASDGLRVLREIAVEPNDLVLMQGFRRSLHDGRDVLASGGRFAVVIRNAPRIDDQADGDTHFGHAHSTTLGVPWSRVVVRLDVNRPPRSERTAGSPQVRSHQVDNLVTSIDGARWLSDVGTLATWDRHSLRSGIAGARDWIQAQFFAMPGMSVQLDPFLLSGVTIHNVIATLPGSTRPDEIVIVGGHYDAIGGTFSPGAEDNASGCAGVIEIARVFAARPPPATMVFVCYSGEEQGLRGSQHQVGDLIASGDDERVVHMLNMDMIGYTGDAELDCLLETENPFAGLLDIYADAAAQYTTLSIATSLFAFGSDHVPFLDAGLPALLTIENDWDSYPAYHQSDDVAANVDLDMGTQILRMNVAALAAIMGVGGEEVFANGFEASTVPATVSHAHP